MNKRIYACPHIRAKPVLTGEAVSKNSWMASYSQGDSHLIPEIKDGPT
jgi:hypothetical protein